MLYKQHLSLFKLPTILQNPVGSPSPPIAVTTTDVRSTEVTVIWTHLSHHVVEQFLINCMQSTTTSNMSNISNITGRLTPGQHVFHRRFSYHMTGLQDHVNYTCWVTAKNIFGRSTSEAITFQTHLSAGKNCGTLNQDTVSP